MEAKQRVPPFLATLDALTDEYLQLGGKIVYNYRALVYMYDLPVYMCTYMYNSTTLQVASAYQKNRLNSAIISPSREGFAGWYILFLCMQCVASVGWQEL